MGGGGSEISSLAHIFLTTRAVHDFGCLKMVQCRGESNFTSQRYSFEEVSPSFLMHFLFFDRFFAFITAYADSNLGQVVCCFTSLVIQYFIILKKRPEKRK